MSGAIYVMWLRQLKRFWRSKARMAGSLGQPLLFLFALGLGFGPVYSAAGQGNYLLFLAPGVIAMSILFTSMFNGIEVIWDRQFGFLKETLVAPVSRINIMIGKTLGGATVALIQGVVVLLLTFLFGFRVHSIGGFFLGLLFMILIAVLFTSLGIAIASRMTDMHGFPIIMNFLIMPIFFLSGALFPLENLPSVLSIITKINPLSYGVDGVRGALTGTTHFGLGLDFLVCSVLAMIILFIGSKLFSKIEL
ncbi:MAG: ABC transporter permease [Nanoarchaeota archaeon]|nr:ABC transporter permease [Nanoarchaeota archaeon]MBU1030135.1 ABC transporter permease [Nanoarchaeota archaeon]MBU1850750.1 ABC transporter permease [Nanoarchaeota archaeon]